MSHTFLLFSCACDMSRVCMSHTSVKMRNGDRQLQDSLLNQNEGGLCVCVCVCMCFMLVCVCVYVSVNVCECGV